MIILYTYMVHVSKELLWIYVEVLLVIENFIMGYNAITLTYYNLKRDSE